MCVTQGYSHTPLLVIMTFGIILLGTKSELHLYNSFFISLPFQNYNYFVGLFRSYACRVRSNLHRNTSLVVQCRWSPVISKTTLIEVVLTFSFLVVIKLIAAKYQFFSKWESIKLTSAYCWWEIETWTCWKSVYSYPSFLQIATKSITRHIVFCILN